MKGSIRKQFAFIFIGLMAGIILLCWFINSVFLEEYYIHSKLNTIHNAHQAILEAANSNAYDNDEFAEQLEIICSVSNIAICIMDSNSQTKYRSVNGGAELELQLFHYLFGMKDEETKVLDEGEGYMVHVMKQSDKEYVVMYGQLNSGVSFIMRTPLESIRESAAVANRFFTYVGMLGTIFGALIIWFVTGRITEPIKVLNRISERMVKLDFEAKYPGNEENEIGRLGANINKLSYTLEQSISELKTANNELQRDIEKKEAIDEMRKEFLANVSHELKTPIALIQGYAEGLAEGVNEDSESREFYCNVIMDEASKMNSMVKKLMTLNQLEFGNDIVQMERFNLIMLLKNCIQSAEILTEKNNIKVDMMQYPPIYVWADEYKVEEVFTNYFTNAMHHCDGEKRIIVSVEERKPVVRVSVFNTGKQIPEESITRVWDKFYKVDKARTREYGGSGIGLSVVKAIMESMNQRYGVENRENGVLFWFELDAREILKEGYQ